MQSYRSLFRHRPAKVDLYHTTHMNDTHTTHNSLNALSFSSEMTSSAIGMNCRLYEDMVMSPRIPSSSSILDTRVEVRGTRKSVYLCFCDSRMWALTWSAHIESLQ